MDRASQTGALCRRRWRWRCLAACVFVRPRRRPALSTASTRTRRSASPIAKTRRLFRPKTSSASLSALWSICAASRGKKLADQLHLPSLNVTYVPVTAADRFEAIRQQKADLLCEPTSATLARRELVDFSIPTFVDGASLMIRADGPRDLKGYVGSEDRRTCRHDDRAGVAKLAEAGGRDQRCRPRQNPRGGSRHAG